MSRKTFSEKIRILIITVILAVLAVSGIQAVLLKIWEAFILSLIALSIIGILHLLRKKYSIKLTIGLELTTLLFIFAAIYIGEVLKFYHKIIWWDTFLHAFSGVLLTFAIFLIFSLLQHKGKINLNPFLLSLFALSLSMTLGIIFELIEFGADEYLGTVMVKSGGLKDTMVDLFAQLTAAVPTAALLPTKPFRRSIDKFINHNS